MAGARQGIGKIERGGVLTEHQNQMGTEQAQVRNRRTQGQWTIS